MDALNFELIEPGPLTPTVIEQNGRRREVIGQCPYFQTERLILPEGATFEGECDGQTFEIWGVLSGKATVRWNGEPISISGVGWVLLPAVLGDFQVEADVSKPGSP